MADSSITALTAASAALTTQELPANEGGTDKKVTVGQIQTLAGVRKTVISSDATANSTTTAARITGMDTTLDVGTYKFEYWIRYVAGATTTGVKFSVNHTGTISYIAGWMRYASTGGAAATAAATQAGNSATGNIHESFSFRAKSTAAGVGPTVSVDTTGDMLCVIEGTLIVTATGTLELYHASEVAASTTVKAGTLLIVTQVA